MKLEQVLTFVGIALLIVHENAVSFFMANRSFGVSSYAMPTRMMITYSLITLLFVLAIRRELIGSFRHSWFVPIAYGALLIYCAIQAQKFSTNMILGNFYRPIYGVACMLSCEYLFVCCGRDGRWKNMLNLLFFGVAFLGIYAVIKELLFNKSSAGYGAVNNIYFLLPIIIYLCVGGTKKIQQTVPALLIMASMFSLKRGAIIMSIAAWCAMVVFKEGGRDSIKKALRIILVLVACLGIFKVVDTEFFNGYISKRFETISEGSGRQRQFAWTIDVLANRSFDKTVVGYGYNGSIEQYGQFVHNDWLLIFFDFGLIGLFLYSCIHVALLARLYRLRRQSSPYTGVLAACYTLSFCLSLYSDFVWLYCANILPVMGCILGCEYARIQTLSEKSVPGKKIWSFVSRRYMVRRQG